MICEEGHELANWSQCSAKFDAIFKANTGSMLALTLVVLVSFKLLTHLLPGRFGPVLENC